MKIGYLDDRFKSSSNQRPSWNFWSFGLAFEDANLLRRMYRLAASLVNRHLAKTCFATCLGQGVFQTRERIRKTNYG